MKYAVFVYDEGLRPVLEGFVATMHKGACKQEVQIWGH